MNDWFEKHVLNAPGVFIIAEAGINHNGHIDLAMELVRQAKDAGADCVKFQTFRTTACESCNAPTPDYFTGRIKVADKIAWSKSLEFDTRQFGALKAYCDKLDIAFMSTACDLEGLGVLLDIGVESLKIGSSDTDNTPLLEAVSKSGLAVVLSTGMCTEDQVDQAMRTLAANPATQVALLQCTSQYPAPYDQVHLRVIPRFKERFHCPVGLSDHTRGVHVPMAAVALGATIIEKHFTLSRTLPGVDHPASLEPAEFADMVRAIREVELALGCCSKDIQDSEREHLLTMRKSVVAARNIPAGKSLEPEDLTVKRPGGGMRPDRLDGMVGRRVARDVAPDEQFNEGMLK